jgi:nitrogen-specific signal transduction histidine kinase
MNSLGISTLMVGLLQLCVPSYALRLVRLYGTRRVGWFLVSAFSSLALLYLIMDFRPAGVSTSSILTHDLSVAVASVLLLIGMGHLESLFSYRRQAQDRELRQHRVWEQLIEEHATVRAQLNHYLLLESSRREHCEHTTQEFEQRCDRLVELCDARQEEALRCLSGNVGAQFSNVLTVINGHARLLLATPQDPANVKHLRQLAVTAQRGALLARQLLVAGGRYPLEREWLNLNELLEELHPEISLLVPTRIVFESTPGFELPAILGDARLIKHIILSLVANVCTTRHDRGVLSVRTAVVAAGAACTGRKHRARDREFVCLTISDTSLGDTAQASEPPWRNCSDRLEAEGSKQVRLASIYGAVSQLGGWVELTTAAQGDNTVKIFFPGVRSSATSKRPEN